MAHAYKLLRNTNIINNLLPSMTNGLHIVKAGYARGQPNTGVTKAPSVIIDHHNLPYHIGKAGIFDDIAISSFYQDYKNYKKVTIGGDHMVAYDSIAYQLTKIKNKKFGLIWVDAHADINTFLTSVTGNKHGMVVSNLMGMCNSIEGSFDISKNYLLPENIVYIGLRSIDLPEREILDRYDIVYYTADELYSYPTNFLVEFSLKQTLGHCEHIHVSFDVDVINPLEFNATGTPVPNGISFNTANKMCKSFFRDDRVKSMDLVEYDPDKDDETYSCGLLATDLIVTTFTNGYAF